MSNPEYARVAAENSVRKELIRFMLQAIPCVAAPAGSSAAGDLAREALRTRLTALRGELLAPFAPTGVPAELARAGNQAAQAVLEEFAPLFEKAIGG